MSIISCCGQLFNRNEIDMTKGSVLRHIAIFSIPLLVGNLFQQLYGTIDYWIVGKYVNSDAFSALGGVVQVLNMLIGFLGGLAAGVEILVARYYGANDTEKVGRVVHTAVVINLWVSVLITIIGIAVIRVVLNMMDAPQEIRPYAETYLKIYFGGAIGLTFYNTGAAILRAVGDSFRPFCYLVLTTVINIVLDIIFVVVFRWDVAGVAWATVLAQGISAVLVIARMLTINSCIKIQPRKLRLNWALQKMILQIGVPAGLQTTITAISNIFLNSYIYAHGVNCMAGWAAYDRLINFMYLPALSISYAIATFVGQNYGSAQMDRVKDGVRKATMIGVAIPAVLMVIYEIFAVDLIKLFQSEQAVVEYGVLFLRTIAPCYIFAGTALFYASASRGLGSSFIPMVVTVCCYVVFRQLFMFLSTHVLQNNNIVFLIMAYNISWIVCTFFQRCVFKHELSKKENELIHER